MSIASRQGGRIMVMSCWISLVGAVWLAAAPQDARSNDWPQFRGWQGAGISASQTIPLEWGPQENVAWSRQVGTGWSSPIVVGDRVFVTSANPDKTEEATPKGMRAESVRYSVPDITYDWRLLCLSLQDGSILWDKSLHVGKARKGKHAKNSYATETPVSDGEYVYAYFSQVGLFCFTLDGDLAWRTDPGTFETFLEYGGSSSPVTDGTRVYLQCDNDEASFVVAYDAKTGRQIWKAERDAITSWSTPFLWHNPQRAELVTLSPHRARSYDPATGDLLWELGGMSKATVPTPIADERYCYLSSGMLVDPRNRPVYAVRPGASGDITPSESAQENPFIAWQVPHGGPYVPSPIVYDKRMFIVHDRPLFDCLNLDDGKPVYRRQRIPYTGNFTASPVAYRGHILCLSEEGVAFLIAASDEFKITQNNPPLDDDGLFLATPALAGDSLLIRGARQLHCVRAQRDIP